MAKISVIIPVYNREKTIKRAIDSVIKQLDENTELVIVNDGSTDKTEDIIKEQIEKCRSNISYYTKENEGVAATRNFGIEHSKGDYIIFVDSDDYITPNLIKTINIYLEEDIDMIKFKATHVDSEGQAICRIDGPIFDNVNGEVAFTKLVFSDILMDSPCLYAFKKELFIKNNLFFKKGTYHEDFGLIPLILIISKSVKSINFYGYNYVQTDESITRNDDYQKTIKRVQDCLLHYDNMIQFIEQFNVVEAREDLKTYYTNAILLKLKLINKKDRKQYIKEIKNRKMINNIKPKSIKQLIKKVILSININWYLLLIT